MGNSDTTAGLILCPVSVPGFILHPVMTKLIINTNIPDNTFITSSKIINFRQMLNYSK